MAEYEAPSEVDDEESAAEKLPPSGSQVELTNFHAGREGTSPTESLTDPHRNRHSRGAGTDVPSTSAEAVGVSAVTSGSEPHASLTSQLHSLSLAPSIPHPTPLTSLGSSSAEDHDLALHSGGQGRSDASHMQGGPEKLLTQEEGGDRDGLTSREPATSVLDPHQELPDIALQRVDSSGSGFTASSPIATPTNANSRHESATSTDGQSYGHELGVSPYVMVKKDLANVSQFESPGLLYARATQERHNWDMLKPADEVAVDVLELLQEKLDLDQGLEEEEEEERERRKRRRESLKESNESRTEEADLGLEDSASFAAPEKELAPIDPDVLHRLERDAQRVAANLVYIMDNLRNSLHAMTVCAQQSVKLHGEAVDNLHSLVDSNVKATYAFLAKFEELQTHTLPLNDLAQQIRDINDTLKVLERNFRTT